MKGRPGFGVLGIGTKLALAFVPLVGITFLAAALAWGISQRAINDIDPGLLVHRPALLASAQAQASLLRMQLHVRDYLELGDPADIEQYRAARRAFEGELGALKSMSNHGFEAEDAQAVRALVDSYGEWAELPQQLFDLHDSPLKNRSSLRLAGGEAHSPEIVAVVSGEHAHEYRDLYLTKFVPRADALLGRLADLTTRQQAELDRSLTSARTSLASVRWLAAAAGLLAVAVAAATATAFRRSVVVPLRRLAAVAKRVTAGDLAARAQVESQDEIGMLANGINTMTERLSEKIRGLESMCAEARSAKAAVELANRSKISFLANMGHELRSPLNAVLGYAHILQDEPGLSQLQLNALDSIQRGGEHLLSLIDDVLDLSRIEAGDVELLLQPANLSRLLCAVEETGRRAAQQKGLSLRCEFAPDLPVAVNVDGKRLEQVLANLLGNAVKFTERGQVSLRVRRLDAPDSTQARLQFEVADSGIGIASEPASDGRRQYESAGLGLAIGQQLVVMMGGRILVESELGKGSHFRFELDVDLAAAHAVPGLDAPATTIGELPQRQAHGVGTSQAAAGAAQPAQALVVPAAEELELLHALARMGNMRSLGERADYLSHLDEAYQPFADRLRELAQRFQSRAILEWILELREGGRDDVTAPVRRPTVGL